MRAYAGRHGIDFRSLSPEVRFEAVERLGGELLDAIAAVVPVLPVSLVATVFVRHPHRSMSELEIKAKAQSLIDDLESRGAYVHIAHADRDYAVTTGLRMLVLRHFVRESDGLFRAERGRARDAALLRELDRALPAGPVRAFGYSPAGRAQMGRVKVKGVQVVEQHGEPHTGRIAFQRSSEAAPRPTRQFGSHSTSRRPVERPTKRNASISSGSGLVCLVQQSALQT